MQILSALFLDAIDARQVPGPSTRLDLTGVQFSAPPPEPFPFPLTSSRPRARARTSSRFTPGRSVR